MKKTITALLCLVIVLCLTAVAWATGAPTAPTEDDIIVLAKGKVTVSCEELKVSGDYTQGTRHGSQTYDLAAGTFSTEGSTVEAPADIDGKYTYTFQFTDADPYIDRFQQDTGYAHMNASFFTTITLEYDSHSGKWQLENNGIIEIKVRSCSTVAMPDTPPSPAVIETGKVTIICESNHHQQHNMREFNLAPGTYYTDETSVFWKDDYNNTGAWFCNVYLRYDNDSISRYTNPFNQANGKHLVNYVSGVIWYVYDSNQGEWAIWTDDNRDPDSAYIFLCDLPTAAELGLKVNVQCKDGKHTDKTYGTANLLANTSLSFTPTTPIHHLYPGSPYVEYRYQVSLTDAAANGYAANYGTSVGKTHTWDKNKDSVTMYWGSNDNGDASNYSIDPDNRDSAAIAVYSDPATDPPEVDPDNPDHRWKLVRGSKDTLTVNATCTTTTTTGGTGGGSSTKKTEITTVKSATTFDAGVALYAGLGILSMTGSAVVIRKKKEF